MGNPMLLLDIVPTWHHPLVSCHLEYGKEQRSWSNADCRYYSVVVVVVVVALVLVVVVVADFCFVCPFLRFDQKTKKGSQNRATGSHSVGPRKSINRNLSVDNFFSDLFVSVRRSHREASSCFHRDRHDRDEKDQQHDNTTEQSKSKGKGNSKATHRP